MNSVLCRSLVLVVGIVLAASPAFAKRGGGYASYELEIVSPIKADPIDRTNGLSFVSAALTTTTLYTQTFDVGATCSEAGWTKVDGTAQIAVFWHVDDFAGTNVNPGDSLTVLAGSKSLWCGARATTTGLVCGYLTLPGYGDNWNQSWRTKTCIAVGGGPTGALDVSFLIETDSEPGYDATFLEYTTDCLNSDTGWTTIDGGIGNWDGIKGPFVGGDPTLGYVVASSPVRVRLRFASDDGSSDEDGFYNSHAGPVVIDNLILEGVLEDFEGEALNATVSNNWEGFGEPGYGQHMALFSGNSLLQQDACAKNLSCQWAAISGSSETYACGGFPLQKAVPNGNGRNQYLNNTVWSPPIALAGSGSVINLQFTVYQDMALDGLVCYTWAVRTIDALGCQGAWRDRNLVYYGDSKSYVNETFPVGDLVAAPAVSMRVRFGVIDQCGVWCGLVGSGACHSHAPLLDKVRVYRVDIFGPIFSVRDIDMFQDTFPSDGTDTGIGRADMARSLTRLTIPTIIPGDAIEFICRDPNTSTAGNPSGLGTDPDFPNGKQLYAYVHVIDSGVHAPPSKSGVVLSDDLGRYPVKVNPVVADGKSWTLVRCDVLNATTSQFRLDLNDYLFEAGDVIEFFFGATNTEGLTNYCSGATLNFVQSDLNIAALFASEFTILPRDPGADVGTDILYVDGADGRGQDFWDTAFSQLGIIPDRYDVRGAKSHVSNRPGSRVMVVGAQLNENYRKIIWDVGDLTPGLGDGTGRPDKSDDYKMINDFLANLQSPGGVYICGDDFPQSLIAATGASATTFKSTYITYTLATGNHGPTYGTAPQGKGQGAGTAFGADTWFILGGCPITNDFDVVTPTDGSVLQSEYKDLVSPAGDPVGGAEISKITGNAKVMISGYSFIYIGDDETDGVRDGSRHLRDILVFLANNPPQPTDTKPVAVNRLGQNYPNPFNPQSTIAFSIKDRARVKIDVYNVAGELVKTLLDETRAAGSYSDVRWDGTNGANQPVASGVYFYKLVTSNFSQTKKMVLLK